MKIKLNLSKLGDSVAESPTVMVGDKKQEKRVIVKPSWGYVNTKNLPLLETL